MLLAKSTVKPDTKDHINDVYKRSMLKKLMNWNKMLFSEKDGRTLVCVLKNYKLWMSLHIQKQSSKYCSGKVKVDSSHKMKKLSQMHQSLWWTEKNLSTNCAKSFHNLMYWWNPTLSEPGQVRNTSNRDGWLA